MGYKTKFQNVCSTLVHCDNCFSEQLVGALNYHHIFAEEYTLPILRANTADIV